MGFVISQSTHLNLFYYQSYRYTSIENVELNCAVDIATGQELEDPGIESRGRRNFSHPSKRPLVSTKSSVQ